MRWKQADLAKMLEVDQASISLWESGKSQPQGFKIIQKLLENGATVEELFGIDYRKKHHINPEETFPPKGEFEKRVCEVLAKHLTGLMKQIKQEV